MKAATLQQFLRELAGPLGVLGLPAAAVTPLDACARALEPFRDLDLTTLADFLRRADEARRTGAVPLVEVPALAPLGKLAHSLAEDVLALESARGGDETAVEERVNRQRSELAAALTTLGQKFGLTVTSKETPNWAGLVRARKRLEELKSRVTGPEAYREPAVTEGIQALVALGDPVLKALAVEKGLTGSRGKGEKLAQEIVAHVTGHRPPGAKAPKPAKPGPDPSELIRVLKEKVQQVDADPYAVSDAEVDELMGRYKAFKLPEKKQIVREVLGVNPRDGNDGLLRLKTALIGVRERIESQKA